jgi:hypothetical protein
MSILPIANRFSPVAWFAKYLTLCQFSAPSGVTPRPNAVADLLRWINVINLKIGTTATFAANFVLEEFSSPFGNPVSLVLAKLVFILERQLKSPFSCVEPRRPVTFPPDTEMAITVSFRECCIPWKGPGTHSHEA